MVIDSKYERGGKDVWRDLRPTYVRLGDWLKRSNNSFAMFFMGAALIFMVPSAAAYGDFILLGYLLFFWWLRRSSKQLIFKMPADAGDIPDKNNGRPGQSGKSEGILYLGNQEKKNDELWFTNSDARTHILYLGTTGSGKTVGLTGMVANALTWGSGFVYIDGKADTDLWSKLSSLCRRFGRDDDLLVLNYMTGNSDAKAPSNSMNPFSSGSASYLTNMLVSLMPDAEGDNAMWKERAVSLIGSLMPVMTWKRDHQELPLSVGTIRTALTLPAVIKLARDKAVPEQLRGGVRGYLDTLPGYNDAAFDDDGKDKPASPDNQAIDTTTAKQQHGYLAMQFTRSLQSLADDYGYIFDTQAADVDMVDVVLNRRILVVLIPALEKSSDEVANLGKIVAATIKGMMGSTLGATVEGESATVIENKPTQSATPFICVFDEVGYYAAPGMGVMAAQARSLGFCLIYSAQDLPALEKRVKEEARSIAANCNIKIFGKLEDPTQTKEFFEKTVGKSLVLEASGFQLAGSRGSGNYYDNQSASMQVRDKADYGDLRSFKEGQAVIAFGSKIAESNIFYANPGHAKAMRVTRYVALPPPDDAVIRNANAITKLRDLMVNKTWTAMKADVAASTPEEIRAIAATARAADAAGKNRIEEGMAAVIGVYALTNDLNAIEDATSSAARSAPVAASAVTAPAQAAALPVSPSAVKLNKPLFKKPVAAIETAAPVADPVAVEAVPEMAKAGGGPMSMFAKKKPLGEPAAIPTAPPPVNRDAPREADKAAAAALDPETLNILKRAGEDARRVLVPQDEDIEAAE